MTDSRETTAKPIVAVQLYTLRDACEKGFDAVFERVARIGFRAVEFGGFYSESPPDLRKMLDRRALSAVSAHIGLDRLRDDIEGVVADARVLGLRYVVCPWLNEDQRRSAADYRETARILQKAGERVRRDHFQLCYHHHAFEFEVFDGKTGLQWLRDETDNEMVKFQIDTYWVNAGGGDPAALIRDLDGRCAMIHLKDRARDGGFSEVGSGTLDFATVFEAAKSAGVGVYVVEQDTCSRDPFDCIETSLKFLKKKGIA